MVLDVCRLEAVRDEELGNGAWGVDIEESIRGA